MGVCVCVCVCVCVWVCVCVCVCVCVKEVERKQGGIKEKKFFTQNQLQQCMI